MIPICRDDPDNVECGSVYINIKDLQNKEQIYMKDVGYLHQDYATEDNGIHSLVYRGEGDVTAYITYSANTIVGTIHRKDGKVLKILSISDQKQVMIMMRMMTGFMMRNKERLLILMENFNSALNTTKRITLTLSKKSC